MMEAFYQAAEQLPAPVSEILSCVPEKDAKTVLEICLRSGRPVVLMTVCGIRFVNHGGRLDPCRREDSVIISHVFLQKCFLSVCGYSVHSYAKQISDGYIPMKGGHRAGICGTMYYDGGDRRAVKNITSLNIRIARTVFCECDIRLQKLLCEQETGLILAGEPGSGKTTLLRAMAGILSRFCKKTAIIDERFEIAPVDSAGFLYPVPLYCDVLSGYPKHIGMQHALRTLAPRVMICDEVGTVEDINAIRQAANAGVGMIVTIHASCKAALERRPQYQALLKTGAFSHVAFMKGREQPGQISEVVPCRI